MLWFHKHKWKIVSTSHAPRATSVKNLYGNGHIARVLLEGITHIYYKCSECGLIKQDYVYGKFMDNQIKV